MRDRISYGSRLHQNDSQPLRVLVACEFSGIVRDAFIRQGHDAVSCDLLPTERPGPHLRADVLTLDFSRFDLIIAHPPCDYLANCGARWRKERGEWPQMEMAAIFFRRFLNSAPYWAVENPVMNRSAVGMPPPTFSVQPWQFGDNEKKRTCFWTNLPPLTPTSSLDGTTAIAKVHREPPSPERKKNRARFFPGMAEAMATQWPAYIYSQPSFIQVC